MHLLNELTEYDFKDTELTDTFFESETAISLSADNFRTLIGEHNKMVQVVNELVDYALRNEGKN